MLYDVYLVHETKFTVGKSKEVDFTVGYWLHCILRFLVDP